MNGYRAFGIIEAQNALTAVARYFKEPGLAKQIASDMEAEVRREIRKKWGSSDGAQQLSGSVHGEAESPFKVFVYTDTTECPFGAVRLSDQTTIIKPFRAKALFIPQREGVRPNQPGLKWGEDFVFAKQAKQEGSGTLPNTIMTRLAGGGSRPNLNEITGMEITKIFERHALK